MISPFVVGAPSDVDLLRLNDLETVIGNPSQASKILEVAVFRPGIIHRFEAVHTLVAEFCTCCDRGNPLYGCRRSSEIGARAYSISDAFCSSKNIIGTRASIKGVCEM